jgi:hypothetical protein
MDSNELMQKAIDKGRLHDIAIIGGLTPEAINHIDNYSGFTPLSYAVSTVRDEATQLAIVNQLIELGANVNYRGGRLNSTILMAAVQRSPASVVEKLIKAGADINAVNKHGHTALKLAIDENKIDNIRVLINNGAMIEPVDVYNASLGRHDDIAKVLLNHRPELIVSTVDYAISRGRIDIADKIKSLMPEAAWNRRGAMVIGYKRAVNMMGGRRRTRRHRGRSRARRNRRTHKA